MADEFKKGDKVVWSSHGKEDTPGVVERKITSDTEAGGRTERPRRRSRSTSCAARRAAAKPCTSRPRSSGADRDGRAEVS
jgi:hypothetical protein